MPLPFLFVASALCVAPSVSQAPAPAERALPPDHRAVSLALAKIAGEHPDLASIVPVGTSRGGRKLEGLRFAAGERPPGRPAILVVANLEGPYVASTGVALDEARELGARYPADAQVKALLDSTTVYVVPCANPDAAEARFAKPLQERRATAPFADDDRDGRLGEDGPSDVDGDGLVLTMRKLDPEGEWISDPADARALVKAERSKGEHGLWKLWVEGRDSDHDEKVGEDPELDVQVARNFPHGWREHAPEAGSWPTCEPEARALCDFVLAHKDIQLVVVYGAQDNLVEKPKTAPDEGARGALSATLESDGKLLAELGKRYNKITASKSKGEGDAHATFQAWCELERGLWCLSISPWTMPFGDEPPKKDEPKKDESVPDEKKGDEKKEGDKKSDKKKDEEKREPSDDAKRLRWVDAQNEGARFAAWKTFQHPELGTLEIGGFLPYALIEPPESERAAISEKQLEFLTSLGGTLARLALVEVSAKDLGGVWEVKAVLQDEALLPLASAAARRTGSSRPARVSLRLPASAKLLAGEKQTLVRDLAGSGGRKELTWLVHGAAPSSIAIEVDSDSAGAPHAVPEVKK